MDQQKVLDLMKNIGLIIGRPCVATKLFVFDDEKGCMVLEEVEPGDWDESEEIKKFLTLLKDNELTQEEAAFFLRLTGLDDTEKELLEVFNAPIEEYLTHENPSVRSVGLNKVQEQGERSC